MTGKSAKIAWFYIDSGYKQISLQVVIKINYLRDKEHA